MSGKSQPDNYGGGCSTLLIFLVLSGLVATHIFLPGYVERTARRVAVEEIMRARADAMAADGAARRERMREELAK